MFTHFTDGNGAGNGYNNSGRPQIITKRQILTVIIVFISIISISHNRKYVWSEIVSSWNYFFSMPKDDPIFRDLTNSTTLLIEDLVKFNVPASSNVIKLRSASDFLSNIISRGPILADSPALYIESLGDKAFDAGTQIEDIYTTGSLAINDLSNELQDIRQHLLQPSKDSLLTQKDVQYCLARFNKIFNCVKKFRGKFVDIERTIKKIQKLYRGYGNTLGFSDIILKYFNENESTYKQTIDMERVQEKLDFIRAQMEQLIMVDREVMRIGQSLDSFSKKLVSFKEGIIYLSNIKIVTQEDGQVLEGVIETFNEAKEIWDRMDNVNNNRVMSIEA